MEDIRVEGLGGRRGKGVEVKWVVGKEVKGVEGEKDRRE